MIFPLLKSRCRAVRIAPLALLGTLMVTGMAHASTGSHEPDLMPVLAALVVILVGAKLGGAFAVMLRQPSVLGELLVGVLLGNVSLLGFHGFDGMRQLASIEVLAQLGVLFLLFTAGLESDAGEMASVAGSSILVAVIGVVVPILFGYLCSVWFFPSHAALTHWFVGAVLCATSVGITARVLTDLKRTRTIEGRIIIGAAVVDDVLGLIVLAVVVGIVKASNAGQPLDVAVVAMIVLKALGFLVAAFLMGRWLSLKAFKFALRLPGEGLLLAGALAFCFGLAYLAGLAGLAPIVGAFAAGLVLDEIHYDDLRQRDHARRTVPELLEPISSFLVPVFFVLMGMRVDLEVFRDYGVLGFASVLTLAAILGKQACAIGVLDRGADRWTIGLGMIPRGEVGLIFAGIGSSLTIAGERVIDDAVFSGAVVMVALTTFVTPPLLASRLKHRTRPGEG